MVKFGSTWRGAKSGRSVAGRGALREPRCSQTGETWGGEAVEWDLTNGRHAIQKEGALLEVLKSYLDVDFWGQVVEWRLC